MIISHRTKVCISFDQRVKPIYGNLDFHFNKIVECTDDLKQLETELNGINDADIYLFNVDDFSYDAFTSLTTAIQNIVGNCKIYVFTNGIISNRACFDSSMNLCLLLHSPSEYQNIKINGYKTDDCGVKIMEMSNLYNLKELTKDHVGKIIIYCGIVKGYMDLARDASNMIDFVKDFIGADEIVFFELSKNSEYYRCAGDLFEGLPDSPDEDTRICQINGVDGIKVKVLLSLESSEDKIVDNIPDFGLPVPSFNFMDAKSEEIDE